MLSFLRLVLVLLIVSVAVTLVVHLLGSTRPMPLATLFSSPDGSPCKQSCLLGIVPGQTTAKEALFLLETHPLTQHRIFIDGGRSIVGWITPDQAQDMLGDITIGKESSGLVDFVEIDAILQTSPTLQKKPFAVLGDLMSIFGSPKGFDAKDLRTGLSYYEFLRETVLLIVESHANLYSKGSVDPRDNVTALMLTRWVRCAEYKDNLTKYSLTPWLGLASVSRYGLTPTTSVNHRSIPMSSLQYCALCQP